MGPAQNRIKGKIESLQFVGDAYEGEILVGETALITKLEPETDYKTGDEVFLQIPPERCLLVGK